MSVRAAAFSLLDPGSFMGIIPTSPAPPLAGPALPWFEQLRPSLPHRQRQRQCHACPFTLRHGRANRREQRHLHPSCARHLPLTRLGVSKPPPAALPVCRPRRFPSLLSPALTTSGGRTALTAWPSWLPGAKPLGERLAAHKWAVGRMHTRLQAERQEGGTRASQEGPPRSKKNLTHGTLFVLLRATRRTSRSLLALWVAAGEWRNGK